MREISPLFVPSGEKNGIFLSLVPYSAYACSEMAALYGKVAMFSMSPSLVKYPSVCPSLNGMAYANCSLAFSVDFFCVTFVASIVHWGENCSSRSSGRAASMIYAIESEIHNGIRKFLFFFIEFYDIL